MKHNAFKSHFRHYFQNKKLHSDTESFMTRDCIISIYQPCTSILNKDAQKYCYGVTVTLLPYTYDVFVYYQMAFVESALKIIKATLHSCGSNVAMATWVHDASYFVSFKTV